MSLIFSRSKAIILMFLTLMFLFLFTRLEAQQFYPVQVRSFVQSPSVFIEDYKDPNNFRVQVTPTDLTVPSLDVSLRGTTSLKVSRYLVRTRVFC